MAMVVCERSAKRVKGKPAFAKSSRLGIAAKWLYPRRSREELRRSAPCKLMGGLLRQGPAFGIWKKKLKRNVLANGRISTSGTATVVFNIWLGMSCWGRGNSFTRA